jgi:pilus assembly protein CpaF
MSAIRQQITGALDLLVQLGRMVGGKRKVLAVAEITGIEGDTICLQEIFQYKQTGIDEKGCAKGHFEACGIRPQILDQLRERGAELPDDLFDRRVMNSPSAPAAPPVASGKPFGAVKKSG